MAGESASEVARRQREKAARLLRSADHWEHGAEGERRTAQVLAGLNAYGYTVLHDLRWPGRQRANLDHVVVGPGGVFVIDSKNWSGRIVCQGNTLSQNGRLRQDIVASAGEAAVAVTGLVKYDATPVICFVRDESIRGRVLDVRICSTSTLVEQILAQRTVLDLRQSAAIVQALTSSRLGATPAPSKARLVASAPTRVPEAAATSAKSGRHRSRRPKKKSRWLSLVVAVLMLLGGSWMSQHPGVLTDLFVPDSQTIHVFGSASRLARSGNQLEVTVEKPEVVKTGRSLAEVAVAIKVRNVGSTVWNREVRVAAIDENGDRHQLAKRMRALQSPLALAAGKEAKARAFFEIRSGREVARIEVDASALKHSPTVWGSIQD